MAIEMIKTELLYPHPQNPRQNVGDVTELSESIKANGIFQNLTVIRGGAGVPDSKEGFTVIIGHRRLAASKQAGIKELPCAVVEMTDKEQVGTMLLENMQRSDLTVYEQAQGFQMMFDLGETMTSISKSTGFSETTIRHRMKLLELDKEKFEASQERCPTITDYIELEKIKDIKTKNKCLEKIGTKDFEWEVKRAIQDELAAERKEQWTELLNSVAEKTNIGVRSNREQLNFYSMRSEITDDIRKELESFSEKEEKLYWAMDPYNFAYLYGKEKTVALNNQKENYAEKEKLRKAKVEAVDEIEKRAFELRKEFVRDFTGTRIEHFPIIFKRLVEEFDYFNEIDFEDLAELLHIYLPKEWKDDDYGPKEYLISNTRFDEMISKRPQKIALAVLFLLIDDFSMHDFYGNYSVSNKNDIENWYKLLEQCGYQMSTEEQKLIDGTHEVFKRSDTNE
ncbi:MAG: ParB/RepB/Spo0J family partition protein [Oscillospiraceae bacterium]|nr:ParB/RepB/Spo0J family partition protein [Oscillospiraceae bacterium]MBQ8884109.1 ParB/RepB/Spo0J family partition protein [Oscillospiraceae bacterium]